MTAKTSLPGPTVIVLVIIMEEMISVINREYVGHDYDVGMIIIIIKIKV